MPESAPPPETGSSRWRQAGRVGYWVLLAGLALLLWRRVSPPVDLGEVLGVAPDFTAETVEGGVFRLSDHAGEVVVLNFWATWCPPCHVETPGFVRLQAEFADRGVLFVGVSVDAEGAEAVGPFAERYGVNYPLALHGRPVEALFGGVSAYPTTLLIDRSGQVRFRHEGVLLAHALRPALAALARERP
jgi:peroxiredoxin